METIAERIKFLSKRFKSLRDFALQSDIDPNSMLSYVGSGSRKPSKPTSESLAKIVTTTECNGHWLLTGDGNIYLNEVYEDSEDFLDDDPGEISKIIWC